MKNKPKLKFPSELRLDLISKDWVVIATGRAKKPEAFKREKHKKEISKKPCPFCRIEGQEKPVLIYDKGKKIKGNDIPKNWTTIVFPNKYPAFLPHPDLDEKIEGGLYKTINAVGFCELVVTRDHKKPLALLPREHVKEVIDSYQERYLDLMRKKFVNYISILHNHGIEAGASQSHPHSQIITTPLIDFDLQKALLSSEKHFEKTKKCVYCEMNEWERKTKKRVVFENEDFLAVCPFASKSAFEIIISPKNHLPYFERINEKEKWQLAEAFQVALKKIHKGLSDPAHNFYLHTAPCDGKNYSYYHWHWTILPKTATLGGFELGARMEISTIAPEKAASYLKRQ
ncbi:MAG: galactose-1-phosphate uridylyltransferase [Candidatus Nealsonbacteria bacterium RBG_13_42_11]|uniref:Galactose-1-phosphate uridylyltransferase n=1 Tax=Candidatus Nealsonbacteria bacterium RBG_13_42_11 TaxID=1801663 RepID=A0A1G2E0V5_9BACT|nr:MAG: galactose-1-phosphate uridylyltransferase [Candidatus Nealsonbacteria bacterium RBG_13_42_11]